MNLPYKRKIIYDFGANNGDDIPYYLKKSDMVVAVEANPVLASKIKSRFESEIISGRLKVEACVLSASADNANVVFYIHKEHHVLSQFPCPTDDRIGEFEAVTLPSTFVVDLILTYGEPYIIKVDLELYDAQILKALLSNGIRPPFISAESHSIDVFSVLVAYGNYTAFNLVDGSRVYEEYNNYSIETEKGTETYNFPKNSSSGPFGEDVAGPWMTSDNFFRYLALEGLGWKDIHATTEIQADPMAHARLGDYVLRGLRRRMRFG